MWDMWTDALLGEAVVSERLGGLKKGPIPSWEKETYQKKMKREVGFT